MGFETTDLYLGEGKDYYSQRNNALYPGSSCNVTAMVQALRLAGYKPEVWAKEAEQPEDALEAFTEDPRVHAERSRLKLDPGCLGIPNRQIHALLSFATNLWTGIPGVTNFSTSIPVKDLLSTLLLGQPTVISTKLTPAGHVVTLAGIRLVGTPLPPSPPAWDQVAGVFLDDPWGDYTSGYKLAYGKKIFMKKEDFVSLVNQPASMVKWGHQFPKLAPKV